MARRFWHRARPRETATAPARADAVDASSGGLYTRAMPLFDVALLRHPA